MVDVAHGPERCRSRRSRSSTSNTTCRRRRLVPTAASPASVDRHGCACVGVRRRSACRRRWRSSRRGSLGDCGSSHRRLVRARSGRRRCGRRPVQDEGHGDQGERRAPRPVLRARRRAAGRCRRSAPTARVFGPSKRFQLTFVAAPIVNSSGAVSPAARATASSDTADDAGERRRQHDGERSCAHLPAPSAKLASRSSSGTSRSISSVERMTIGQHQAGERQRAGEAVTPLTPKRRTQIV